MTTLQKAAMRLALAALTSTDALPYEDWMRASGHPAIKALRTALAQQAATIANAEPAGWQPIETAPKDGRPILLFGDCRVTSGHWSAPSETPRIIYQDGFAPDTEWDEWEPYWESWDGGFTEEHPPTHWMPLPAAPKEQQ